jgi:hypothetical protein
MDSFIVDSAGLKSYDRCHIHRHVAKVFDRARCEADSSQVEFTERQHANDTANLQMV